MKQGTIIAIILGVLLLVTVVQAVQLNNLKGEVTDGQLSVGTTAKTTTSSATKTKTATLPSSIKDLPQMVGGC